MPIYKAPLADVRFVLDDVIGISALAGLPGYEEATPDLIHQILEEGGKLCEEVLFPLNQTGDAEGCTLENGAVRTPTGFREAYDTYMAAGWQGLACDPAYGGQGLPKLVNTMLEEFICSANLSFGMYPGLSLGAYNALALHGSDELKTRFLPRLADGSWSGTMCLTEPHCGTDLGLVRTRAVPRDDGSYAVSGTKIFISAGDHDLTDNILHLVLARLPGAPAGTRGISLFLVPKRLPTASGAAGPANGVTCGSIEHKMGIKGSSTCVLNFEESVGWLVGEPDKGMRAMFTMMNAARLAVGIQGLGLAEVAYQNAVAYARERLQGRSLKGAKAPDKPADPIIVHPDVRRSLLTMRAFVEGARALGAWVGFNLDVAERHGDDEEGRAADELVQLMTPIVKALFTDIGFDAASLAVQVYGGHGYIRENGVEQYLRDARITQIYEGTNGIQALDLVGRKLPQHMGRLLRRFFHPVAADLDRAAHEEGLEEFAVPLAKAFGKLQQATLFIARKGMADPEEAGAAATDYLRLFGLVALGWMWLRMVRAARAHLATGDGDRRFFEAKLHTARFYMTRLLPQVNALFPAIMAGAATLMDMDEAAF
jgi:alkylation response protein AidB-like acyl-CoA dehydrogenase